MIRLLVAVIYFVVYMSLGKSIFNIFFGRYQNTDYICTRNENAIAGVCRQCCSL